ncbi:MAG: hypothetical protein AB1414_15630 [bacterium]
MEKFYKVLVAKYSPKNRCYAKEGEILIIATERDKMRGKLYKDFHFFVGINSRTPSMYGWVKEIKDGITPLELAERNYYVLNKKDMPKEIIDEEVEKIRNFLSTISKQKEEDAMAVSYTDVGFPPNRKRVLKTHKVFFFPARSDADDFNYETGEEKEGFKEVKQEERGQTSTGC